MIKFIATDMDGTLLGPDNAVSEENKIAIIEAQKAGIEVIVCTGRSFHTALPPIQDVNLQLPFICMNGAAVYSENGNKTYSLPLNINQLQRVTSLLNNENQYFELYADGHQYSFGYKMLDDLIKNIPSDIVSQDELLFFTKNFGERHLKMNIEVEENAHDFLANLETDIYKIIVFSIDFPKLESLKDELQKFRSLAVSSSHVTNIEITHKDAQKGLTLRKYIESRGGYLSETMTIGDSYNDVSMFKKSGFSVAMGNAPEDIKAMVDHVTASNSEHGFAEAVYKVIKMNEK